MELGRHRIRAVLLTAVVFAVIVLTHNNTIRSHQRDVEVITSVKELPLEYNLPEVHRLGCIPNGTDHGRAYFEYCGAGSATPLLQFLDLRYGCRVCRIYLIGSTYSDCSVRRFGELSELRELHIYDTRVSTDAMQKLSEQLPDVTIYSRRPDKESGK
jgi:hypothetical protein